MFRFAGEKQNLVGWRDGSFADNHTLKGFVAELAACLGADVASEVVVEIGS